MSKRALVTGAGGFIGGHLVKYLKKSGYWVRGVDMKFPEFRRTEADEFEIRDLRLRENCMYACRGIDEVYALASDMGGMGYLSRHSGTIIHNNALINLHTLEAARVNGAERYFFSSSACVYPDAIQTTENVGGLMEDEAFPAGPPDAYGWEKLFTELACGFYAKEFGTKVRIARFHNIYGPYGSYNDGREKVPAALCRKIAQAADGGSIEMWGDGEQTRSFCYVDDCVEGIYRLMQSDCGEPVNIGSTRLVSINHLAQIIIEIARKNLSITHVEGPQGVRGRNSDNTRVRKVLDWEPRTPLENGMRRTYKWIEQMVRAA